LSACRHALPSDEASEQQRARFLAALETAEVRAYSARLCVREGVWLEG